MSTLTQWMEQTLGGASNESAIVVDKGGDKGVDKGVTENTPQENLKAAADTLSVSTSKRVM